MSKNEALIIAQIALINAQLANQFAGLLGDLIKFTDEVMKFVKDKDNPEKEEGVSS